MAQELEAVLKNATVQKVLAGAAGAVGMWLFGLWRNKTAVLTYSVHVERFAASVEDEVFGSVSVRWRDNEVPNLYLATLTVENPTLRDLDNVVLHAYASVGLMFLSEQTSVEDTPHIVPWDPEFVSTLTLAEGATPTPQQQRIYNTGRQYKLPVFNRGQRLRFSYLCVHEPSAQPPTVFLSSNRLGTKVVRRSGALGPFGVPQRAALGWGLTVTVVAVVACAAADLNVWLGTAITALVGLSAQLLGAATYRGLRRAKELLAG